MILFIRFISTDSELTDGTLEARHRREIPKVFVEPPHLCTQTIVDGKPVIDRCHVYTTDLDSVKVQASLRGATNQENETHSAEWCNYPLGMYYKESFEMNLFVLGEFDNQMIKF